MNLRDWFDLAGYAASIPLLALVVGARLLKRSQPVPKENAWFVVFGGALLIQSALPGAHANRWLAFMGLWLAWAVTYIPTTSPWPKRVASIAITAFAAGVILDAGVHFGRAVTINPNTAAAILLLGLPLVGGWRRAAIVLLALAATQSRGALLGLGVAVIWLFWLTIPSRLRVWLAMGMLVVTGMLIGIRTETIGVRLEHWAEALRLWSLSPLAGWGTSSYLFVSRIPDQVHADSAPLTLLAEQGLIGVAALAPLVVLAARRFRSAPVLMRMCLIAFVCQNLVDDTWLSPWPALLLGLNIGLMWGCDAIRKTAMAQSDPVVIPAGAPAAHQLEPMV